MWMVGTGPADEKCAAQIFSTGKSDFGVWYNMWAAVTAVFSVCVRVGRGGVFTGLGRLPPSAVSGCCGVPDKEGREGES